MQHIDEHGCLTQRSQLDRLRDLADGSTRERIRTLEPSERLSTTVFVIDATGTASTWDLDHLALARSAVAFARGLPFIAAVLATFRFVGESTLCIEGLLVFAEQELASTVCTIQCFIVERIHETLISWFYC